MSTRDVERVQALIAARRISRAEGERLLAAFGYLDAKASTDDSLARRARVKKPSKFLLAKVRFLAGEIDASALLSAPRRVTVSYGVLFALAFAASYWLLPALGFAGPSSWVVHAMWIVTGGCFGGFFGSTMQLLYHAMVAKRLLRLKTAVDSGIAPIEFPRLGQCPTCGAENSRVLTWRHPLYLQLIVNPVLGFNELILGQRFPAQQHKCRECGTDYVDCPSCKTSSDVLDWSFRQGFGNYTGIPCQRCGAKIPCLRNMWSFIVLLPFTVTLWLISRLKLKSPEAASRD